MFIIFIYARKQYDDKKKKTRRTLKRSECELKKKTPSFGYIAISLL